MKELDKLVENYFIEKKGPELGMDMLLEMVEQSLEEAIYYKDPERGDSGPIRKEKVQDDIRKYILRKFPHLEVNNLETKGETVIQVINVGTDVERDAILRDLADELGANWVSLDQEPPSGKYKRATTNFYKLLKSGETKEVYIELIQGTAPKRISNLGNFMEGIVAYALASKFINKGKDINLDDVKSFADKHKQGSKADESGERREIRTYVEKNSKTILGLDRITFVDLDDQEKWKYADLDSALAVANSERYKNYIETIVSLEINADGVSNQGGEAIDIRITGTKADGTQVEFLEPGISLKNLSKQLWQSGKDIIKISKMFKGLFGVTIPLPQDVEELNNLVNQFKKSEYPFDEEIEYFNKLFTDVANQENKRLKTKKGEAAFLKNFFTRLPEYATKSKEGTSVPLMVLSGKDFKIYDFSRKLTDKSAKAAVKYDVKFEVTQGKPSKRGIHQIPNKLQLKFGDKVLFQLRPKIETSAGTFRFYLETGDNQLIKDLFALK